MRFTVELTIWVDPEHPEVNLSGDNYPQEVMEQLEALLYEDDYIRLEDITVKEDK
jgi:hypothetical protein